MSYLLRVELPDIPGSLGRLASAIGAAGANIDAIEIVGRDGARQLAIDDVFIAPDAEVMPDSIVSACNSLDGVKVLWISRYAAGGNLFLDLEAVESMTEDPVKAIERLVDSLPTVFRVDWGVHLRRDGETASVVHGTPSAPTEIPDKILWPENLEKGQRIDVPDVWSDLVVAGSPLNSDELVVVGRRGGPEFLDSEIARLAHLIAMAASLHRNA
ncbi:ACT domain-containing protein [Nocardioides pocheonensis]|uniref:ACT domain-containing protein n=1 Tax=Nocardioides pocheonensis TaxID=661485 RepID=A0A3N0GK00_9ACTN|nr:ACT domain-containing protein [Nocardioides pocheonensis]RNM12448.1 ACT domain-containing protein [Nocardioides pocheonensis]